MRITYLKLINNVALMDSLNKSELEINLKKDRAINLVLGKNGSGKSTLLREMNPYFNKSNFTSASSSAYKEIHIQNNADYYIIQHYLSDTEKVSSKISKNNIQLNEKGGVNAFKEIVLAEIGFNDDFFKIGIAGSEISGFIELNSSDRKNFMQKFIPDLSEYIDTNKKVKEKITSLNRTLNHITSNIDTLKFDEVQFNEVQDKIKVHTDLIEKLKDELNLENNKIALLLNKFNLKPTDTLTNQYKQIVLNSKNNKIINEDMLSKKLSEASHLVTDIEQVNEKLNELIKITEESDLEALETNISQNKTKIKNLNDSNEEINKKINNLRKEIQTLNSTINESESKVSEFQSYIADHPECNKFSDINADFLNKVISSFEYIDKKISEILSSSVKNPNLLNDIDKLEDKISILKNRKLEKTNNINVLNREFDILNKRKENREILKNRPTNCKIDTCPFIANALRYDDPQERLDEVSRIIEDNNVEIISIQKEIDDIEKFSKINLQIETLIEYIKNSNLKKFNIFNQIESKSIFINYILNKYDYSKITEYNNLLTEVVNLNSNIVSEEKLQSFKDKLVSYNELIESYQENLNNNLTVNESTISVNDELEQQYNELKIKFVTINADIKLLKSIIKINEDLIEVNNKIEANEKLSTEFDETLTEISKIKEDVNVREKNIEEKQNEFDTLNESYIQMLSDKKTLENYVDSKTKIETKYNDLNKIKDATDPIKGIPLFITKKFLGRAKSLTNNLLNTVYKGIFNIDFKITDKSFFIEVIKSNGSIVDDISMVSNGQRSIIKTALYFALVNCFMSKYDILILDELDAVLDNNNRQSFIDILKEQIKILNLEQIFVVSHSPEIMCEEDINVILFPGHSYTIKDDNNVTII